jgi:hypothetical protein
MRGGQGDRGAGGQGGRGTGGHGGMGAGGQGDGTGSKFPPSYAMTTLHTIFSPCPVDFYRGLGHLLTRIQLSRNYPLHGQSLIL